MTYEQDPGPVTVPAGYQVDRWQVGRLLGEGGWGSVYAGEPLDADGEPVALKFLPSARLVPAQRSLLREVVERETEFSRLADHTHLIRTHAVLTLSEPQDPHLDGAVVLVMERAETSLKQQLIGASAGTALPEAGRILVEVCRALADMHEHGWIHGDLKPGNVLLMADGSARLADFGLTTRVEGTHAYVPRIGSSDYLPPEWWSERVGERGIPQRPTADIWAFGVLAHQVVTGGLYPFAGTNSHARTLAVQSYARGAAPLRLDERIPAAWRELITECLTPDQAARSKLTIARVLEQAEAVERGGPHSGGDVRRPRRRRRVAIAAGGLAAVTAAAGAWWLVPASPDKTAVGATSAPGSLGPHAAVPAQYRGIVTTGANFCAAPAVTPALIAAILKEESNFDPNFSSPQTASYGIAGWTPSVFHAWAISPQDDYMKPQDAVPAMAEFLCWLDKRFTDAKVPGDITALLAAGYDTSDMAVIRDKGVPPKATTFAADVVRYTQEFEH